MRLETLRTFFRLLKSGQFRTIWYRIQTRWYGLDFGFVDVDKFEGDTSRVKHYDDSGGPRIKNIARKLDISGSDRLLDIGCGKAGAILAFSAFPFAQVDGVEISERIVQIAKTNLRKMNVVKSVIYSCDAANFTALDQYTHFYMYNPFPAVVMRCVAANIAASALRRKRRITLIYATPADHTLVIEAGFKKVGELFSGVPIYFYTMDTQQE